MSAPKLRWLVDRRTETGPVGDQGGRGTCLSFAATAAHDHERRTSLSIEYLHWATARYPLGTGRIASLVAALGREGQPPEAQWPYDRELDETTAYSPPPQVSGPFDQADVALIAHEQLEVTQQLQAGVLPVIGLRVNAAFLAGGGVIDSAEVGSDGHAVLAVGVAELDSPVPIGDLQPNDPLVLVRNSWGPRWGASGHALLTPRTWSAVVITALTVIPRVSSGIGSP